MGRRKFAQESRGAIAQELSQYIESKRLQELSNHRIPSWDLSAVDAQTPGAFAALVAPVRGGEEKDGCPRLDGHASVRI